MIKSGHIFITIVVPIVAGALILTSLMQCSRQDTGYVTTYFETGDRIQSHPVIDDGTIYFGSNDNGLYAIDLETCKQKWSYTTSYNIQGSVAIQDSMIYFSNGSSFYALDKNTGENIWKYRTDSSEITESLDPWDYHHGAPVINDSVVYFGSADGCLYCFNVLNGNLQYVYPAIDSAAIRCTPVIQNKILYFGDWNGRIYALDIVIFDTLWTHKTYQEQPYPTFGQVNTRFCIYDSLLVFGARNPELQVMNVRTGTVAWTYVSQDGGWISGDPIVAGDTLFIGGSDNHRMFAFNVHTGELYWTYEFLFNNFSRPLITDNYLLFTTGDAYAYMGSNYGRGYLYALNRADGSIVNFALIGGNLFTTPVKSDNRIFIGSDDNQVYSIDLEAFIFDPANLLLRGYNSINDLEISPNPFQDSTTIYFEVNYPININAAVYDLEGNEIKNILYGPIDRGIVTVPWDGTDEQGNAVQPGYYMIEVNAGEYFQKAFILKE